MTDLFTAEPPPGYARFKEIPTPEGWFRVYQVAPWLYALFEPRHYEATIVSLILGRDKAALIDTGCGIGDLRRVVEQLTNLPVMVVNTHTHLDHLGSNRQFGEIAMFDHPRSHHAAEHGADHGTLQTLILDDKLVIGPWPEGFDPDAFDLPPFRVSRWLRDGDVIDLGGRSLEVIHTPGEAPDHICLLDRADRVLFCGDILLNGGVWAHLEGGSVPDLLASYRRLAGYAEAFDTLMPCHNEPWLGADLLPEALAGAEKIVAGEASWREITDPWGMRLREYRFARCSILTRLETIG